MTVYGKQLKDLDGAAN